MKIRLLSSIIYISLLSCSGDEEITPVDDTCRFTETEEIVIRQINEDYAHPFETAEPYVVEETMTPLIEYLGDVKVVGLGEATHGSAEFFKMKDKLFRELVRKKDFKAVIFEFPWGNGVVVDDFVLNGTGTADEAMNQSYYWVYDTQETRDLANWMRDYNQGKADEDKIHFVSCDPQGGNFEVEKAMISEYLRDVSPALKDSAYLKYFFLPKDLQEYEDVPIEEKNINRDNVDWVYRAIEERRESFVSQTGKYRYEVILMAAHVIQHREFMYRKRLFGQTRDSLMAIYADWWRDILGPDEKVAVWAHNLHVSDNPYSGAQWMGSFLRDWHGSDYKNVGFSFTNGRLNAFLANAQGKFSSGVQSQLVPENECYTLNYLLSQMDSDQYYLIFDEVKWPKEARLYLNENQSFYQMGAGFNRKFMHNYTHRVSLPTLWDVMIHFDEVKASVLM